MEQPAPTKHENLATTPYQKIKINNSRDILHLPGGQRTIIYSWNGSFRVWDMKTGTQVGEEWEDKCRDINVMALSPDGKTVATVESRCESRCSCSAVRLWNIDAGKIIKTLGWQAKEVISVCWSPDGGRVVSGSRDATFRVEDVESGATIIGPIYAGRYLYTCCYSPDGKVIATGGDVIKIWDANKGKLLKTLKRCTCACLAWTSDGKTLFAGRFKIDTATWKVLHAHEYTIKAILLFPNERIFATTSYDKTVQLWNADTNQPIGEPLHHEARVNSTIFLANQKFLVTSCFDHHLYTWDVSAILEKAGLPSDFADAIPQETPKISQVPRRRILNRFFDNIPRDSSTSHSQGALLGHLPTFFSHYPSKLHTATKHDPQRQSRPLIWTQNLVSGIRIQSQLREPPIVEVPCTAGKPRNHHAREKTTVRSSRPPIVLTGTSQGTTSSSQQSLATVAALVGPPVVTTAVATGTLSHPDIIITRAGSWTRFWLWIGCISFQHIDGQQ